jgi:hypothetical protein
VLLNRSLRAARHFSLLSRRQRTDRVREIGAAQAVAFPISNAARHASAAHSPPWVLSQTRTASSHTECSLDLTVALTMVDPPA